MALDPGQQPLRLCELPDPKPGAGEVIIRVSTCGVCHTELDEIEGRTPPARLPMVLGHQAVGRVIDVGPGVESLRIGDRVGVGWLYSTCGSCEFCQSGSENLCPHFRATGRDVPGGYAEQMAVPQRAAVLIPDAFSDLEAAPLLCAGAIGLRSLRLAGVSRRCRLGLAGFGASAHLVLKTVRNRFPDARIFVFSRSASEREFARQLGAEWSGEFGDTPPELLDAVIDTTPAWKPVVDSLYCLRPGGRLVINAIRKEPRDQDELLRLDYASHLWQEKEIKSVANVARRDIQESLAVAAVAGIRPEVQEYPLEEANQALLDLKQRRIRGAKVLRVMP